MLQKLKKTIHYCIRYIDDASGVEMFNAPEKRLLNIMPINSNFALVGIGEIKTQLLRAKICNNNDYYKEGDRIYLAPPDTFDGLCSDADYVVKLVSVGYKITDVILERLVAK